MSVHLVEGNSNWRRTVPDAHTAAENGRKLEAQCKMTNINLNMRHYLSNDSNGQRIGLFILQFPLRGSIHQVN